MYILFEGYLLTFLTYRAGPLCCIASLNQNLNGFVEVVWVNRQGRRTLGLIADARGWCTACAVLLSETEFNIVYFHYVHAKVRTEEPLLKTNHDDNSALSSRFGHPGAFGAYLLGFDSPSKCSVRSRLQGMVRYRPRHSVAESQQYCPPHAIALIARGRVRRRWQRYTGTLLDYNQSSENDGPFCLVFCQWRRGHRG